jgi:DNA-binding XRE family transcriptional regulator
VETPTQASRTADTLGNRIRTLRITKGLTQETAARTAGVCVTTWRSWEAGTKQPRLFRGMAIAAALAVPVAALFRDDVVADVVLSADTVQRIRAEGRPASEEAAKRLASRLETELYEFATRRPVDVRAGARPKRRRSRAEVLTGIRAAETMRADARSRRQTGAVLS